MRAGLPEASGGTILPSAVESKLAGATHSSLTISTTQSSYGFNQSEVESVFHTNSVLDSPAPFNHHQRPEYAQVETRAFSYEVVVSESRGWSTKWKRMIAYVIFIAVILFTGTVLLLTVPSGHCEEGCTAETCKVNAERQPYPCTCVDEYDQTYCAEMVLSRADERHKTAAWVLVAIAGMLVLAVPCVSYWYSGVQDIIHRASGKYSTVSISVKYREVV